MKKDHDDYDYENDEMFEGCAAIAVTWLICFVIFGMVFWIATLFQ